MPKRLNEQTANNLCKIILDEFGKEIYRDKNPHNVSRRYLLTRTKLADMLRNGCVDAPIEHHALETQVPGGGELREISPKELRRFEIVARLGRCALLHRDVDPQFFVHPHVLKLAQRLRTELVPEIA